MWPCWLMALFQRFWRRLTVISHAERLITDGPSSVGEVVMFGAGRIEHRELICYTFENRQLLAHPALDHTESEIRRWNQRERRWTQATHGLMRRCA